MVKKIHYQNLKKKHLYFFEGLLIKIKSDLIKLLLNLNIVVSTENESNSKKLILKKKGF